MSFRWLLLFAILLPGTALAADADRGEAIARRRCASCHIVAPHQRGEVAQAPPFAVIGRKSGFDSEMLMSSLLELHPRMNFSLTRREATDLAAYISGLAK